MAYWNSEYSDFWESGNAKATSDSYARKASNVVDPQIQAIKAGWEKRLNTMHRRLAAFFRFTSNEFMPGSVSYKKFAHSRNEKGQLVPALITLTYPSNESWEPRHIADFIAHVRKYAARNFKEKLRYCWVAETTKKGVIHYHVVVWLPRREKLPKPDKQGWWPHGLSEISSVRKGVYSYLLKYISKGCDMMGLGLSGETKSGRKQAARIFGYGGLNEQDREHITHQMLPKFVKEVFGMIPFGTKIKRVKGGWECDNVPECGHVFVASNYESAWNETTRSMEFKYGVRWSALPETKEALFIPF